MNWYIYALVDPRDDAVRYVGATTNPKKRYAEHMYENNRREIYKHRWVTKLRADGLRPQMIILEENPIDWAEAERRWIAHYRAAGARLTNLTDGGEGTLGYNPPAETRQRMSEAAKRRPKESPEITEKRAAQLRGRKRPPEVVAKTVAARAWYGHSSEVRKRISESVKGFRHTDEARRKISEAGRRPQRPETIAKISARHKGKVLTPEHRAKLSAAKMGRTLPEEQKQSLREALTGKPQRCGLCKELGHKRSTCSQRDDHA